MKGLALLLSLCFCNGAFASEALFRAIDDHRERAALELLAGGKAALEARNPKGDTPLHRSVETGLRQLTKALLDAGADPDARTRNGETALHLAAPIRAPGTARASHRATTLAATAITKSSAC
jgi:ankyrin repeat protein